jgi:triacylglycerol esterase/lipase EstA (alpha/beta hydrolase family)
MVVAVAASLTVLGLDGGAAAADNSGPAAAGAGPTQTSFPNAYNYALTHLGADPSGANAWSCVPNAAHPYPVVLVHGTFENKYDNWAGLAPVLKLAGYCVFALNYGGLDPLGLIDGTGEIASSANQLARFISQVLAATGASKVDIVGHSQGGMLPRYYIKYLGGANLVDKLIGLVPSNHGTTVDGVVALAGLIPGASPLVGTACASCAQQFVPSSFLTALNSGGETNPAVTYTVITTVHDEVVTPYTSAFLAAAPNVTNETVQQFCPLDLSEHVSISYDPVASQLVLHALNPSVPLPGCS